MPSTASWPARELEQQVAARCSVREAAIRAPGERLELTHRKKEQNSVLSFWPNRGKEETTKVR